MTTRTVLVATWGDWLFVITGENRHQELAGQPVAEPVWLDTVVVPSNGGSVTFRSRFLDFTGKYVLHCHMMNHEDMGMMQVVEVYDE